jgi:hypothetical protein
MKAKLTSIRTRKPVEIAGDVVAYVRPLTVGELRQLDQVREKISPEDPERDLKAGKALLTLSLVDQDGTPIFESAEDPAFEEISLDVLGLLFEQAAAANSREGKA